MDLVKRISSNMYVELAKRNLKRHAFRTILAAIGIIIGVIAISSMGILGNSLKLSVSGSLGDVGNEIVLYPAYGETVITEKQVDDLSKVGDIEYIIPLLSSAARAEYKDEETFTNVYGIERDDLYPLVELEDGHFLRSGSKDCVVGASLADDLDLELGSRLTVQDSQLRVVGILKESGFGFAIDPDRATFITPEAYEKLFDDEEDGYNTVIVKVKDLDDVETVAESIEERLNKKEETVTVLVTGTILESIDEIFNSISLFLMGIGSISLLVAGVSILNVMLMSTMERTKEIGIMKAVGASRNEILKMFMLEALFLGIAASLIGGVLSFGGGFLVNILILDDASYLFAPSSILYIVAGVMFGIITSLAGGMYPAWKASNMRPLDALRYE
ncbi:MAG: ABC transporter permease [Methanosarcinaceae archaeon]|nr:ABC transporter permease [Methanosarcinaceae archaeon]